MDLFSPVPLGSLKIKNRFVRSATWEGLATDKGEVTPRLIEMMETLARGEVGLIITGHAYVSPDGQASPWQISVATDDSMEGLSSLSERVHANGSSIFLQISHAGIFASSLLDKEAPGPSSIEIDTAFRKAKGREMDEEEIKYLIRAFGDAALRAKNAGFDGVQIHAAHGYLLSQFLSPYFNRRRDEYGGDIRGRSKIILEVYRCIREKVGNDFPVIIKLNCEDFLEGGFSFEDMLFVSEKLEQEGIDGIEMSGGTLISRKFIPSRIREKKEVYYRKHAMEFKKRLEVPLILVGGIRSLHVCNDLVKNHICDFVALSRPLIREPGLINRWKTGDESPARCLSDNLCFKPALKGMGIYCYRDEMDRRK